MSEEHNGQKNKMSRYQMIIIIVAALVILGVGIFFIVRGTQKEEIIPTLQVVDSAETEEEVTEAVSVTTIQLNADDVVATVNGEDVTGADVQASYEQVVGNYGEPPDEQGEELYYAMAMDGTVILKLIQMTGAEMGVDQFTDEELTDIYATSDSEWQYALDNYVSYNLTEAEDVTDEDKAAAYAEAEAYYAGMGYSKEVLRQNYVDNEIFERVKDELCKDVTVTDDEVLAYYDNAVASDKEIYEFDPDAYENQMLMLQYGYANQEPWYHPEGYRYVKHILLAVDETLLANYTDLLARYEEQMNVEEEEIEAVDADADTTEDTAEEIVTAEDIDAAKAAIIASVQDQIDEIDAKLAEGASFGDLVAEYGTDPGMTSGQFPDGYEVSLASYGFVPEFVSASFSLDAIGDISQPYISDYGVHIVKYIADVPGGPVELTDALKNTIYQNLMDDKCNAVLNDWYDSADVVYTGVLRSMKDIQAEEAAAIETPVATEEPEATEVPEATEEPMATEEPTATEVPAATETPVATEEPAAE